MKKYKYKPIEAYNLDKYDLDFVLQEGTNLKDYFVFTTSAPVEYMELVHEMLQRNLGKDKKIILLPESMTTGVFEEVDDEQ